MRLDHLLSMETMPCESMAYSSVGHIHFGSYSVLRVPASGSCFVLAFSVGWMRGRARERREIILAYIDRARRSPDEADAGNGNFMLDLEN